VDVTAGEMSKQIVPIERVVYSIRWIRGQKVLLDSDLAVLNRVATGNLNKAVKRNVIGFLPTSRFSLSLRNLQT
jgi:hypothetical protein